MEGKEMEGKEMATNAGVIDKPQLEKATETLQKYKRGKLNLEKKVIENEQWWKLRHWEYMRSGGSNEVRPVSAWLFNSVANKHADAMDNYPEPNVLARALDDEDTAKQLATVLPVVLEQNNYEDVYSDTWWYKLKQGTGIKGIFWNPSKNNGLGDIDIRQCDILNLFWEPGVKDIQDSLNLFHVSLMDNSVLMEKYPGIVVTGNPTMDVSKYIYDDDVDTTGKSVVVDWYYKKNVNNKPVLHYVKYVNDTVLYASENTEEYKDRGYYDHGMYPFVFDKLFVEEGTPCGFGYIDVMKDPQMYIDRLNQIILENAMSVGRTRWLVSDAAGINDDDLKDPEKRVIRVPNLREETIREIMAQQLDSSVISTMTNKIEELKETSGNRDFSQGSTSNGVTAASAISALMEAGSKLSRDMISSSYRAFEKECYLCIELIRQFYTLPRQFRITGEGTDYEYVTFDNAGMQVQPQGMAFDTDLGDRLPVFDIKVSASKKATYSRMAQNELAIQLFGLGIFNPQNSDQALALLEIMDFDGKEKIIQKVKDNGTMYDQMVQMQQQMSQMAAVIDNLTAAAGIPTNVSGQVPQDMGMANPQVTAGNTDTAMSQAERSADRARNAASVGGE
nr:MAG TPA: portal protein [Caudoviricetes sp.]